MPITVPYKKEKIGSNTTVFMFESLSDYEKFVSQADADITTGNARRKLNKYNSLNFLTDNIRDEGARPFGTTDLSKIQGNYTEYLFNRELDGFINNVRNKTVRANVTDLEQKKKIKFTEQEIGIFSFDLASIGLIRVYAYWSEAMNDFVDNNSVRSRKDKDGKVRYYFVGQPAVERHELIITDKGFWSTVLKKKIPEGKVEKVVRGNITNYYYPEQEEILEHEVEQRQVVENGKPKFSTTWKKSFIYIPKVINKLPRIDIVVTSAFAWGDNGDTQMIWSCMAAIALAEKLQQSGVNFRVFVAKADRFDSNREVYSFTKIKDSGDPVNINTIAIATSDPRQFRVLGFKGIATTANVAGYDSFIPSGLSYPIYDGAKVKSAFVEFLKKTNDIDPSYGRVLENSKIVFTQALSERQAIKNFDEAIKELERLSTT